MKFRHELKYRLNFHDYTLLKMRLDNLLEKDRHVTSEGFYTVRSLYFDDLWNTAYTEKMTGIKDRQKFRIRLYNQSSDVIRLERKIKSNQYVAKQISTFQKYEVDRIVSGSYEFLLNSDDNLKQLFYYQLTSRLLRPRVVVEYDREPYILGAGELRISFDKNISAGEMGFDIFDSRMPMIETMDPGLIIMEVKFLNFIPEMIRRMLPSKAADFSAFSKFILCCDKTMHKKQSYLQ